MLTSTLDVTLSETMQFEFMLTWKMNVRTNPSSKRSDYCYQEIMLDDFFQHKRLFFRKNGLIEFLQLFKSQGLLFLIY